MTINTDVSIPEFIVKEFSPKKSKYCLCIPIINEIGRIDIQLKKMKTLGIDLLIDIIICDGGSTDGSTNPTMLKNFGVNTLLIKNDTGKQGAQLRIGFWWGLQRGYEGFVTIDGNNKDSVESIPLFIEQLDSGFDFIQGSRFIKGGSAINTPLLRYISILLIHAPIISITARHRFTDTTNAFRAYSKKYLSHEAVQPFRSIFQTYELLAYLSTRASQIRLKVTEVPVSRIYPKGEKTPTKISPFRGNLNILSILIKNAFGVFLPR
ncbi:MAG: glycosyltransferase family 2 protein [Vallitaleaceae bacterium]|nr:glycosyltransferase family 2 protein [Vallitaleaceae bacterium]